MIEIDGKIISTDILTECFCCDLAQCKGICCVEGNSGAPLDEDELEILETEYYNYRAFMKAEGIETIEKQGFYVIDADWEMTTPLVDDAECAYSVEKDGNTMCAIELAWKEGKTSFRKPLSCHLYPIRLARFSNGTVGLNYHRWDVCLGAVKRGKSIGLPVYQALKEPLIRTFGADFYDALCEAEKHLKSME